MRGEVDFRNRIQVQQPVKGAAGQQWQACVLASDQPLPLADAPRSRARSGHLHRLVQRASPAPLTQANEQRADAKASPAAGPRAVQSTLVIRLLVASCPPPARQFQQGKDKSVTTDGGLR